MLKRTFYAEPRDQTREQARKRESVDLLERVGIDQEAANSAH